MFRRTARSFVVARLTHTLAVAALAACATTSRHERVPAADSVAVAESMLPPTTVTAAPNTATPNSTPAAVPNDKPAADAIAPPVTPAWSRPAK